MSKELLIKNDFGTCEIDNDFNWIFITYSGKVNVKLGTEILEMALMKIKEKKCPGIIVNSAEVMGTFTMTNDYIANEWIPEALANGCKYNGVIVSSDIFTQFASESLEKKVKGVIMKMFNQLEDAIAWIKSVS